MKNRDDNQYLSPGRGRPAVVGSARAGESGGAGADTPAALGWQPAGGGLRGERAAAPAAPMQLRRVGGGRGFKHAQDVVHRSGLRSQE